jgi:hypothetical protein
VHKPILALATGGLALGAAGLALGLACLVESRRQHDEHKHLALTRLHADALSDLTKDPVLSETVWPGVGHDEAARRLLANRWVSLWTTMNRLGYLARTDLPETTRHFMEHESFRTYWELKGSQRHYTARDEHDVRVYELLDEAYESHARTRGD